MTNAQITLRTAETDDVPQLFRLYYEVYDGRYPLKLGSDPVEMKRLIHDPDSWFVIAESGGEVQGAALARRDPETEIAIVEGVAVLPQGRRGGLARGLLNHLCDQLLTDVHSVYATCRTVSPGPQRMMLSNGFLPYGIMPNAVTMGLPETLALFVRHRDGILAGHRAGCAVPAELAPLTETVERVAGVSYRDVRWVPGPQYEPPAVTVEFETVDCPRFVRRRCLEKIPDPADRFYPFHEPNLLLVSADGALEVYVHHCETARYATLVGAWPDPAQADEVLEAIVVALRRLDICYVESLVALPALDHLRCHLAAGFVPSALYPAMNGRADYVLLSRTTGRLDFRNLVIDPALRRYLECYRAIAYKIFLSTERTSR